MTIKLTFPNGEHEPVVLNEGVTAVGTGSDCQVVLVAPGIALHHCEIFMRGGNATLHMRDPANVVVLNGRQLAADTPVKAGDLLLFGKVGCQVMAAPPQPGAQPLPRPVAPTGESGDDGRTKVRQALPKFILRGVSGPTFGKTYALVGTMTIGRQQECDISIPAEEISRQHVRLQVSPDGVMVEDMGSANGTFVNDKRVHSGLLKPGEELRLDTVRFILMAPGMTVEAPKAAAAAPVEPEKSGMGAGLWIGIGIVVLIAAAVAAKFAGLF